MLKVNTIEPSQLAQVCVIWLHGLGSSGANMRGVAEAFPTLSLPTRHVLVDAPVRAVTLNNHMHMQAWYDVTGLRLEDREDRSGILESERALREIIADQAATGIEEQQIYLAGFSQGGAMALFTGLRSQQYQLGGVISLSAYLPLRQECPAVEDAALPIFMAMGTQDPIVMPMWTRVSRDAVLSCGFKQLTWKEYPIEHTICLEEINDIAQWLEIQMMQAPKQGETL